jgi:hypothetical protein
MMLGRGKSMKSELSGATTSHLPAAVRMPDVQPATHGLLVALVSADHPRVEVAAWPLWLVPGVNRRGGRFHGRSTPLRE